jgi:tyrosyl-tRNA synthetase
MDRFELVKRDTQEIVTEEELKRLLEDKKHPIAYWGTAPTGRIHVGYWIPILKISDFLKAGFKFKILIANLHAHLDDQKTPWELLEARSVYYQEMIEAMLDAMNIDRSSLIFVRGSDFQLNRDYVTDVLRISAITTMNRTRRAASEVVRVKKEPMVSTFIYPIMMALDEEYMEVDVQYAGVDQRKIMMFAREYLPMIGHKARVEVMTPMLPSLVGGKMSASEEKGKLDLLDSSKEVEDKIKGAYCKEGEVKENGVISFCEYFLFPWKGKLKIERDKKFGGDTEYANYKELEKDFINKKLHPMDLKKAVSKELNELLEPIRRRFEKKTDLLREAYPSKSL